jgi:hypothetical protein
MHVFHKSILPILDVISSILFGLYKYHLAARVSECFGRGTHMKTAAVEYGAAKVILNVYE